MAIPSGYSRNTFYGHLPGGELFNVSLWCDEAPSDQTATQNQATAFATEFANACTTPPASSLQPTQMMASDSGWDGVRVYSYTGTTGKATYVADASINRPGANTSSGYLPNECAIAVTLRTSVAGRSATGRIYVPAVRYTVAAGGQIGTTDCSSIATWWSKLITALNSHISTQHVVVLSQKLGTSHSVNSVSVDSKIDVQRRRQNKQLATFKQTVTVT